MLYSVENEYIRATIDTHGAELISVVNKVNFKECMWNADPSVWKRHAPILFPYTGNLTEKKMTVNGKNYPGAQHGFARDMDHKMIESTNEALEFELRSSFETREIFPFDFILTTKYTLDKNSLLHTVTVTNPSDEELSFGIGFHPAFACPFDEDHDTEDYEFRFDRRESPIIIETDENGLLNGKISLMGANIESIPLTDRMFDNDSMCMCNLKSRRFGIFEKNSDRSVICDIEEFPYTLIWSKPTEKLKFVCIEPWHSLPGFAGASTDWSEKPAAAVLKSNEVFMTTLRMEFNR